MKTLVSAWVLIGLLLPWSAQAADGLSGAWTSGTGTGTRTYVFKVRGQGFSGVVCGPCDDPASVFKVADGQVLDANRVSFSIEYGSYREQVAGVRSGTALTLTARREGSSIAATTTVVSRVVETYQGLDLGAAPSAPRLTAGASAPSPLEGRWIAAGRTAQQNFILKIRGNTIWGLICGPCTPQGVFLIDDGVMDGNNLTFYINHMDTPVSDRSGLSRNIMRGTLTGNVMKFKWVREGAENEPGGEMVLIGPIR